MVSQIITFLSSAITGILNIFGLFYSRLSGLFDLYFVALVMFLAVRFLLVPIIGRNHGSDRAGKKKNNSEGGESA